MSQNKFKVGDKIKYIDDDATLETGAVYTVSRLHKGGNYPGVELVGFPDTDWWSEDRFELQKQETNYEIIKPFSIIDLYEKNPCAGEFSTLLKQHGDRHIDAKWNELRFIKKSRVLMRNLDWLEKNGFISKVEEEWINIYLGKDNVPYTGDRIFKSKQDALTGVTPGGSPHVGSVLKR